MCKRLALGLVFVIIVLGIVFLSLDILDIDEDFRLDWPAGILNTVFISAVAVLVAYVAARYLAANGSPQMLWLGCGALVFGAGVAVRAWMIGEGLNVPITVHDTSALIASALHLIGAISVLAKQRPSAAQQRRKQGVVLISYLGTIVIIALVTLLAFRGVIPTFASQRENATVIRNVVRGIAAASFAAASFISFRSYIRSHTDFYYWYSLGLVLFALGVVLMSLGAVESRIAWLGRASQYTGGIYFLVAVIDAYRHLSPCPLS